MGKLQVIVGGQFGSEGKGALAGYLAAQEKRLMAIRVGGSNAGHTVWSRDVEYKLRHVPVAAVTNVTAELRIAAGSTIDPVVLAKERQFLQDHGYIVWNRLKVDRQATLIDVTHKDDELDLVARIGSTGKGNGAALADRIMRRGKIYGGRARPVSLEAREWLRLPNACVQVEGSQGYGLGLHAGFYPFCTSRDCRAIDILASAGISPWDVEVDELEIWVTLRTFVIRVAGDSGPLKQESTWAKLGLPEEKTTVTRKIRRVGAWDPELAHRAILANGPSRSIRVALMGVDHIFPQLKSLTSSTVDSSILSSGGLRNWITSREKEIGASISLIGTSPQTVIDLRQLDLTKSTAG